MDKFLPNLTSFECVKFDSDDSLEYYFQTSQYINKASNYSIEAVFD